MIVDSFDVSTSGQGGIHNSPMESQAEAFDLESELLIIASRVFGRMNMSMDAAEMVMRDLSDAIDIVFEFSKHKLKKDLSEDNSQTKYHAQECLQSALKKIKSTLKKMGTETGCNSIS